MRAYVGASGIRKEKDSLLGGSDFLRGMGDIDARPLVGVSAGYTLGEAVLSGSWQFTRKDEDKAENGLATQQIHLNLSMPLFDLAGASRARRPSGARQGWRALRGVHHRTGSTAGERTKAQAGSLGRRTSV